MKGLSQLTKREKYLLVLGALVLLGAVLFQLVYDPLLREKKALGQELEGYRTRLAEVKQLASSEKELDAKIAALKGQLALLERVAPANFDTPKLIKDVEAAGRAAPVNLIALRFLPPVPNGDLTRYPVDLLFSGKYPGVSSFVTALEQLPRPVLISSLSLKPDTKGVLQVKLTAAFFVDQRGKSGSNPTPQTFEDRGNPFEPPGKKK
ncbi:MAG: type 4a pilus biogenesis protein PilO [Firmicutes bacterium]|nr:type 4a pilus biogenesis protein PilO [Bacillota bacterium]